MNLDDLTAESLTIYFHEPGEHQICEQNDDGMILILDEASKQLLGFELLYYKPENPHSLTVESESFIQQAP